MSTTSARLTVDKTFSRAPRSWNETPQRWHSSCVELWSKRAGEGGRSEGDRSSRTVSEHDLDKRAFVDDVRWWELKRQEKCAIRYWDKSDLESSSLLSRARRCNFEFTSHPRTMAGSCCCNHANMLNNSNTESQKVGGWRRRKNYHNRQRLCSHF